jgi:threonine synthase
VSPLSFVSTRGTSAEASLREALFRGLAPDGGLYMPHSIPALSPLELDALKPLTFQEAASRVGQRVFEGDLPSDTITRLTEDALDFPLPLLRLSERMIVLDLSRGPTLAFKDVGARYMARLMAHLHKGEPDFLSVLTATSGDTGGAVAHAFVGLPGVRVVILFPDGRISPSQERQFSTLGENIHAVAVQGDFDDCQRLAKEAFGDRQLRETLALTSANSINVGRFLPQAFYFIYTWAQLRGHSSFKRTPILFSVPSGNFGNLAAGLLAKSMGLSESSFLAATNANDGVPRYLSTGVFEPRPSRKTMSTAMDVGDPSNFARILHLYEGDLERLRRDLTGQRVSDEETRKAIRHVHDRYGHLLDPHTAVGFVALERALEKRSGTVGVLLATASPAKFADVLEPVLGRAIPLPPELVRGLEAERRVTPLEPTFRALSDLLKSL